MVVLECREQIAQEWSHDFSGPWHLVEVDHEVHDGDLRQRIKVKEVLKHKLEWLLADSCVDMLREQRELDTQFEEADQYHCVLEVRNAWQQEVGLDVPCKLVEAAFFEVLSLCTCQAGDLCRCRNELLARFHCFLSCSCAVIVQKNGEGFKDISKFCREQTRLLLRAINLVG